jgi:hypothetical protein
LKLIFTNRWKLNHSKLNRIAQYVTFIAVILSIAAWVLILASPSIAADPEVGKSAAVGVDKAWQQLFLGNGDSRGSTIFATLANSLQGLGILGIAAQTAFLIAKNSAEEGLEGFTRRFLFETMLPTIFVVILLSNNGEIAGKMMYGSRGMIFGIDKIVYESFKQTTRVLESDAQTEKAELDAIKDQYNSCLSIPQKTESKPNPAFTECFQSVKGRINAGIASGKIKDASTVEQLTKSASEIDQGNIINVGSLINVIVAKSASDWLNGVIKSLMEAVGFVYMICIDMALLILGLALPLVLMFSLYKFEVFSKWAPQIVNMLVAKITYTLAVGIAGILSATSGLDLGAWGLSLLLGLGSPFVSIYTTVALSGAMGSLFQRESLRGLGAGIKGAGKLGGAAAGAATNVAGAIGNKLSGGMAGKAMSGGQGASQTVNVVSRRIS